MSSPRALFVQPFSVGSAGGGCRILRSLVRGQPFEARSLNCDPYGSRPVDWLVEKHLPLRRGLGRIDRTRFCGIGYWTELPSRRFFERRLAREMDGWPAEVVHVVAHWTWDFHAAWRLARERGRRVVLSVHDDLAYVVPDQHPLKTTALEMLRRMWHDVDHVFSISQELGDEYNARYGSRSFELVTDGLDKIAARPVAAVPGRLRIYFMGLFHYSYGVNLRAFTQALAQLKRAQPGLNLELVMRCGGFTPNIDEAFPAQVLPYADQATVERDMETVDLLYMPLPFGKEHEAFVRFSLSTKMVSYLGSGVPILFHGPPDSAAAHLLERNGAAFSCHSLEVGEISKVLKAATDPSKRRGIVENGLRLAARDFQLGELRQRFLRGLFPQA